MAKKSISKWEREQDIIFHNLSEEDVERQITKEELSELANNEIFGPLDYETREKFLKDNKYEITRENLINSSLPSKGE